MIIRIDVRRLTDSAAMHAVLAEAFGLSDGYGKNLDALVDCLTDLDKPQTAMSRVQLFPGQVALLSLEHSDGAKQHAQMQSLLDAVAFVNWRRLEQGQPPVLAVAYDRRS
jgi:RNAse (barnase) inhibitor barstar